MKPTNKKIFAVNGIEVALVMGARWYFEFDTTLPNGLTERHRPTADINRIKDLQERELQAPARIAKWLEKHGPKGPSTLALTLERMKSGLRKSTYQGYGSKLRILSLWCAGGEDVLDPEGAGLFINDITTYWSLEYARSFKRNLSSIYTQAKLPNPFAGVQVLRQDSTPKTYFRRAQIDQLKVWMLANLPWLWMAARILCYCFIRNDEMRNLQVQDINLDEGTIVVPGEVSKNKKTLPVVIPDALIADLRTYLMGAAPGDFVFTKAGRPGPDRVSKNYLNNKHRPALAACGIVGNYSFYSWKHTGAVLAVQAGINLKDLQLQLRHHSLDMVDKYLRQLGVFDSVGLRTRFPTL